MICDPSSFALWKFKAIEGSLRFVKPLDFTTTRYDDGKKKATITYDLVNHTATIEYDDKFRLEESCAFSKLVDLLKKNEMYLIRSDNRHENSKIPFDYDPDKI